MFVGDESAIASGSQEIGMRNLDPRGVEGEGHLQVKTRGPREGPAQLESPLGGVGPGAFGPPFSHP